MKTKTKNKNKLYEASDAKRLCVLKWEVMKSKAIGMHIKRLGRICTSHSNAQEEFKWVPTDNEREW